MADTVRVGVQQRRRLIRDGLSQLLQAEDDIRLIGAVASVDELVLLCDAEQPGAVVLEVDGGNWDPARVVTRLTRRNATLVIVGLYDGRNTEHARRIRQRGIRLVSHQGGIGPILHALRGGRPELAGAATGPGQPRDERSLVSLTERETSVLTLIGGGFTTREISTQLQISHKTVENHKQRIFGKLEVQNQAHAVSIAVRQGLISPEQSLSLAIAK